MLVNTITISYLKKGKVQIYLSLWKCKKRKEPPIRTTNSIIFPLLNEKPFSFHETVVVSSTTNRPFEDNFYTNYFPFGFFFYSLYLSFGQVFFQERKWENVWTDFVSKILHIEMAHLISSYKFTEMC